MNGIIHSVESLAAVDGEGLRCSVFMAGCPLRCAYCHNPDTWQMTGKSFTPDELLSKIKRFKVYFGKNGGVTFSGGEPLLQSSFIRDTVVLLKEENINYILDTSGHVELNDDVKFLLENSQEVLLDLKFWDDASYRKYTSVGIDKTLSILEYLEKIGKRTIIRTVIIPDINDSTEIIDLYLKLLSDYTCISKYELLGFHTLGFFKYDNLGIENPFKEKQGLSDESLKQFQKYVDDKTKEV